MADKSVSDILRDALSKPKSVSADGESVSQYQLSEMLEAAAAIARRGRRPGARISFMKPTGNSALGD